MISKKLENCCMGKSIGKQGQGGRKEERVGGSAKYLLNKYNISKLPVKDVLMKKGSPTEETLPPGKSKDDREKQVKKEESR